MRGLSPSCPSFLRCFCLSCLSFLVLFVFCNLFTVMVLMFREREKKLLIIRFSRCLGRWSSGGLEGGWLLLSLLSIFPSNEAFLVLKVLPWFLCYLSALKGGTCKCCTLLATAGFFSGLVLISFSNRAGKTAMTRLRP